MGLTVVTERVSERCTLNELYVCAASNKSLWTRCKRSGALHLTSVALFSSYMDACRHPVDDNSSLISGSTQQSALTSILKLLITQARRSQQYIISSKFSTTGTDHSTESAS